MICGCGVGKYVLSNSVVVEYDGNAYEYRSTINLGILDI
jgi:hypothetical protein